MTRYQPLLVLARHLGRTQICTAVIYGDLAGLVRRFQKTLSNILEFSPLDLVVDVIDIYHRVSYFDDGLPNGPAMLWTEVHLVIEISQLKRGLYTLSYFVDTWSTFWSRKFGLRMIGHHNVTLPPNLMFGKPGLVDIGSPIL